MYNLTVNGKWNSATIRDDKGIVVRCGVTKALKSNTFVGFYPTMFWENGGASSITTELYPKKIDALIACVYHLVELGWEIIDNASKEVLTLDSIKESGWERILYDD